MIDAPWQRPDSSQWDLEAIQARSPFGPSSGLVINVRAQGRWATFLGPDSLADTFLRPGILAPYAGPARGWLEALPLNPGAITEAYTHELEERAGPLAVPLPHGSGLLVIDYDHQRAFGMSSCMLSGALDCTWEVSATHARYGWARELLLAGRLPQFVRSDLPRVPQDQDHPGVARHCLPAAPPDTRNAAAFISGQTGVDPAYPYWFAPLVVPGWDIVTERVQPLAAFRHLAPHLHPGELAAWKTWASDCWPHVSRHALQEELSARLPIAAPRTISRL